MDLTINGVKKASKKFHSQLEAEVDWMRQNRKETAGESISPVAKAPCLALVLVGKVSPIRIQTPLQSNRDQ
jgi:hypothetical protein